MNVKDYFGEMRRVKAEFLAKYERAEKFDDVDIYRMRAYGNIAHVRDGCFDGVFYDATDVVEVNGRYFELKYLRHHDDDSRNEYIYQPREVRKVQREKVFVVTEWVPIRGASL